MERDGVAKLRSELAAIIEEHMPSSAREISGGAAVTSLAEIGLQLSRDRERKELADALMRGIYADVVVELLKWPDLNKKSEQYATRLIEAQRSPRSRFGRAPIGDRWEKLRKAAIQMQGCLDDLGREGRHLLNLQTPRDWRAPYPLGVAAHVDALAVIAACAEMQGESRLDPSPQSDRDWAAAAVADEARKIWAEELDKSAPVSEKNSTPGPFGRFLNAVLAKLPVRTTTAQSALRALKDVQKENEASYQKVVAAAVEEGRPVEVTALTGGGWRLV
jgi:hypothetical protein